MRLTTKILVSVGTARAKLFGGTGLKSHVFRGGTWLSIGSICEQLFRLGRNVALTRLLAPEAFGVMAIIYSTTYVVDSLAQIGMKEAIIQNPKGHESSYVNSAWWLGFLRGLGIYTIMFLVAPWVGHFYGHAEIGPLMHVALLGIVFTGLQSPQTYVALKEMKFKKWSAIQLSGGLMGTVTIILLALAVRSVWALAIGYAVENLIRCTVSYLLCPFRPHFTFDRASTHSLLVFSRGVFGLSFLYLIFSRADVFVLGKMYAASDLGVYTMALYLVQVPASFVMGVLSQTLMPTFARIQDDDRRLNAILNRVTSILVIIGMPALVFVILTSHSILKLMYGTRYLPASTTLAIAALVALFNITNSIMTALFFALGRPQFHRRCALVMAVVMLVLIYPSVKEFGLMGGQIAALVSMIGGFASQLVRMEHLTGLDLLQYGRSFPYTLAVSAGVMGVFLCLFRLWPMSNPLANLTLGLVACALTIGIFSKQLIRQLAT